ncbi:pantothenate synthetase [Dokdonia sp. Hel_I_63]|uniref:pantoate--beta-alanine ligase n=1 Tax=unclassified Dokdonia TaxID=2615033 RepID=UPI00020A6477|nr:MULTISPECIES: pantoate--beta-alanine ligase [unclassified Dokdonia]AEE18915.1 pantoate/beta-alanine ligase [Dokdonia sp. 4H-3-7-5]TVZ21858.1 pantothenate synthetase [Dokdonia sp. Hel_I_63]
MQAITAHKQISKIVHQAKSNGKSVGFVPTMGALHHGHASLIDYAFKDCALIIVSIFVNPTQFNNASDLDKYPRTLDKDLDFLAHYGDKVIVYAPTATEVYGNEVSSTPYNFGTIEKVMEGEHRPGHFDGVGTVLNLLFRQVNPDKAYFGEKDYQQLAIVRKLVEKEKLPIEIIGCPIHRQEDGLAMSSRNARLTENQLAIAPFIYEVLRYVKSNFDRHSAIQLRRYVSAAFEKKEGLELEYFEIANIKNLSTLSRKRKNQQYRAFLAVYAGEIRLIDNIALN